MLHSCAPRRELCFNMDETHQINRDGLIGVVRDFQSRGASPFLLDGRDRSNACREYDFLLEEALEYQGVPFRENTYR